MNPPSPTITSKPTNSEALDLLRADLAHRRYTAKQKSSQLRIRFAEEEARLEALIQQHDSKDDSSAYTLADHALADRITGTRNLIDSARRNYIAACDDFAAGVDLTVVGFASQRLIEVERRLVAVEVGLQGIERVTTVRDMGDVEGSGERSTVRGGLGGGEETDNDGDVDVGAGDGVELDRSREKRKSYTLDDARRNPEGLPLIGFYRVR